MGALEIDALTRWLAYLSPGFAATRLLGQARLKAAERYYEAVIASGQRPRRGNNASADAVMDRSRELPREYTRRLDENHDISVGILDDLVTNIVGSGAAIEPMAAMRKDREPAMELNRQLSDLWAEFWTSPEVTGELPGPEMERIVCRSWLRDGEVFAQHVTKSVAPFGSRIPYALELLEADFVPFDYTDANRYIVHGVQKDGWGRPIGYYVLRQHPGSISTPALASGFETVWLPAERAMHLKFTRRLHQTRGVSIFHSVIARLNDLYDYEKDECLAARIAASLCAYVKKEPPMDGHTTDNPETGNRELKMEGGMIIDTLRPGEDIGMIDPQRPNPNLETFRNAMLRAIAAGTSTRFSSIAKNYNGTYSAQRQELVEGVEHYRRLFDYLRQRFYLPVWRRFVDNVRLAGLLRLPAGVDEQSVYRPEIRPPQMPWIDPQKELTAHQIAVSAGFKSRAQVIRDMGGDPAVVDTQIEKDPLTTLAPISQPASGEAVGQAAPDDDKEDAA